jgi:hypothetical protein
MPKPFNHTGHKDLWGWLAENPGQRKFAWPKWVELGGNIEMPYSACFACDYGCCPLDYEDNDPTACLGGLYDKYVNAKGKRRAALAAQIRDLPVRDGVTCI